MTELEYILEVHRREQRLANAVFDLIAGAIVFSVWLIIRVFV